MSNNLEEKTIQTEVIFEGRVVKLQVDDVTLPNGEQSKRELIKHPGAVAIIALTEDQKLVLVKQYRKPLEKSILEIPAGKLEPGEEPEVTAKRELEEETGYTTHHLEYLTSFYTSPGFADELLYIYFADQLIVADNKKPLDEDEFIEIVEVPIENLEERVINQEIHDAKTMYALLYIKQRLEQ